jgi:hypothetical protein
MNATTSTSLDAPAIISLRNYRHLAGHHGHDLAVSIYGGDASAALECETCKNTPSQEAILAALVAFTRRLHIEPQHLASHLTAAANQRASAINEDGLHAQLTYLLETLGAQPAYDLITRIAAETRRG